MSGAQLDNLAHLLTVLTDDAGDAGLSLSSKRAFPT
jgi:hypothetical protein